MGEWQVPEQAGSHHPHPSSCAHVSIFLGALRGHCSGQPLASCAAPNWSPPGCIFSGIDEPVSPKMHPEAELNSRRMTLQLINLPAATLLGRRGRAAGRAGLCEGPGLSRDSARPESIAPCPGIGRVTRTWQSSVLRLLTWLHIAPGGQTQTAHLGPQPLPCVPSSRGSPVSSSRSSGRRFLPPLHRHAPCPLRALPVSTLPGMFSSCSAPFSPPCC